MAHLRSQSLIITIICLHNTHTHKEAVSANLYSMFRIEKLVISTDYFTPMFQFELCPIRRRVSASDEGASRGAGATAAGFRAATHGVPRRLLDIGTGAHIWVYQTNDPPMYMNLLSDRFC